MRKTILRRLETLEEQERSRLQRELSSLSASLAQIWTVVLGCYVGGLKPEHDSPFDAHARALKYSSSKDFPRLNAEKDILEFVKRHHDAYCELFAARGLDFDQAPMSELFEAFVTLVDQLPEQWLTWFRSDLEQFCDAKFAAGSNLPRGVSRENFLVFA
jgi:hypothetical protein